MTEPCNWPSGTCQCWIDEQMKPDHYGRIWMHCESGLKLTKTSLAGFTLYCLSNNILIGELSAFNANYKGSLVLATVKIREEQIEGFTRETGGILTLPPKICLN